MAPKKKLQPTPAKMRLVQKAFLEHGYGLSMRELAKACDLSPRALYYYFSSKEEAFRAMVRFGNESRLDTCFVAGRKRLAEGGSVLDVIAEVIDVRYGDTRRQSNASQHLIELNAEVFRRCVDIVVEVTHLFEMELAKLIDELQQAGRLRLRAGVAPEHLSKALANGARGINQRAPAAAPDEFAGLYREMCGFLLYGSAELPPGGAGARVKPKTTRVTS
jgi:AcrR family transcriptional regulator